jgi:hypothetical protein
MSSEDETTKSEKRRHPLTNDALTLILTVLMGVLVWAGATGQINETLFTIIVLVLLAAFGAAIYWAYGAEAARGGTEMVDAAAETASGGGEDGDEDE